MSPDSRDALLQAILLEKRRLQKSVNSTDKRRTDWGQRSHEAKFRKRLRALERAQEELGLGKYERGEEVSDPTQDAIDCSTSDRSDEFYMSLTVPALRVWLGRHNIFWVTRDTKAALVEKVRAAKHGEGK